MRALIDIIARKRYGIDCSADESTVVTRWFLNALDVDGELPNTRTANEMVELFSCERDEVGEYIERGDVVPTETGWDFR